MLDKVSVDKILKRIQNDITYYSHYDEEELTSEDIVSILTGIKRYIEEQQRQCKIASQTENCMLKTSLYCSFLNKQISVCDNNCVYKSDNIFKNLNFE